MSSRVNVLLIGGGGREHALALALRRSPRLGELWLADPGNAGLARIARPIDVPHSPRELYRLEQFCDRHAISLVVVGPEEPLALGYADRLRAPNRLVFGPCQAAAQLEASKAWAKQILRAASVPIAEGRAFRDPEAARQHVESRAGDDPVLQRLWSETPESRDPSRRRQALLERVRASREFSAAYAELRPDLPVIKASGLCKGKGVVLPRSLNEALDAIDQFMVRRVHGDAGAEIVIEERLTGTEASILALVDGRTIYLLESCQDHKRLLDGDQGPNTGGMGAFCPSPAVTDDVLAQVQSEILVPTIDALRREGIEYCGVLYAGLILTHAGPKVLEFNVRFGDPECQALLPRLESDLLDALLATCQGRLADIDLRWTPGASCCVVLASAGYPDKPRTGVVVEGIEQAEGMPGVSVFHAGTRLDDRGRVVSAGGRVLNVAATGADLGEARSRAYAACDAIRFDGMTFRRDIGLVASVTARSAAAAR